MYFTIATLSAVGILAYLLILTNQTPKKMWVEKIEVQTSKKSSRQTSHF